MSEEPDPLAELTEATMAQYELYAAWVRAGFSPDQAFELVKAVVQSFARNAVT